MRRGKKRRETREVVCREGDDLIGRRPWRVVGQLKSGRTIVTDLRFVARYETSAVTKLRAAL